MAKLNNEVVDLKITVDKSKFKRIIDERGIKQSHFVKKFGFSPSTMSALYRGDSTPSYAYAVVIARELGVAPEDIWPVLIED